MPKLVAFTVPDGQRVYLNPGYVTNVHEAFSHEGRAAGTATVIICDGKQLGVKEELEKVLELLKA